MIRSPTKNVSKRVAIAEAFLAFAAMMKADYGISKEVAVLAIQAAYDTNAATATATAGLPGQVSKT